MALLTKVVNAVEYKIEGPGIVPQDNPVPQFENIISTALGLLTIIAIIFFTIQIILAGYGFISSAGDQDKIKNSRKKITNSLIGIAIVAIAYGLTAFFANILGLGEIFNLESVINSLQIK